MISRGSTKARFSNTLTWPWRIYTKLSAVDWNALNEPSLIGKDQMLYTQNKLSHRTFASAGRIFCVRRTSSFSALKIHSISCFSLKWRLLMPSKHFLRWGWTRSGSFVSERISNSSSFDKKKNLFSIRERNVLESYLMKFVLKNIAFSVRKLKITIVFVQCRHFLLKKHTSWMITSRIIHFFPFSTFFRQVHQKKKWKSAPFFFFPAFLDGKDQQSHQAWAKIKLHPKVWCEILTKLNFQQDHTFIIKWLP